MVDVSDSEFEELVEEAVAAIPKRFADHLDNVAFLVEDVPTQAQLAAGGLLHGRATLLGLYQGIPLPRRNNGYNGVAPDVITIFRRPHLLMAGSIAELKENVRHTVWHEVAHYFGLDHGAISEIEHRKEA
jgi:predicted Zn-dependent protease with MMP-like domain